MRFSLFCLWEMFKHWKFLRRAALSDSPDGIHWPFSLVDSGASIPLRGLPASLVPRVQDFGTTMGFARLCGLNKPPVIGTSNIGIPVKSGCARV